MGFHARNGASVHNVLKTWTLCTFRAVFVHNVHDFGTICTLGCGLAAPILGDLAECSYLHTDKTESI